MKTHLPRLSLFCLGPANVRVGEGEQPAELLWRPHVALLIHLALSPGNSRTRDHLIGLIWPEKPEERARPALNESLRRLRHALGAERLESLGDSVRLNPASLEVDALRFDAIVETDPGAAVALVRGEFLEGFRLDEAPGFEEWMTLERQRWHARIVAALIAHG